MKLTAIADPTGNITVGVVIDVQVHPVADLPHFWQQPFELVNSFAPTGPGIALSDVQQVPLVPAGSRVLCIGLNYRAHAEEGVGYVPDHPTIFGRWTASLSVGGVPAPIPANEPGLDWEGEIAAYIGRPLSDADPETARNAILGYSTFNDLTARRAQKLTSQWTLGKNGDCSGPMGPLVTADEVGDLRDGLRLQTRVNGATVQDGNSRDMIFEIGDVLSLISRTLTLQPGDVVATGTPDGVGYARTPEWFLQPGDVVEVEVDKLGVLRTPIVAATRNL